MVNGRPHGKAGPPMIAEAIVVEDTAVAASVHWPWTVGLVWSVASDDWKRQFPNGPSKSVVD